MSWLLYGALRSAGVPQLPRYVEEGLHASFAAQLEGAGMWHLAVFVLAHIENATMRAWTIQVCAHHLLARALAPIATRPVARPALPLVTSAARVFLQRHPR
jgi:hypothetical protein